MYSTYITDSIVRLYSNATSHRSDTLTQKSIKEIEPSYTQWIEQLLKNNSIEDVLSFLARGSAFLAATKKPSRKCVSVQLNGHLMAEIVGVDADWCVDILANAYEKQASFFHDSPIIITTQLLGEKIPTSQLGSILLSTHLSSDFTLDVPSMGD